MSKIAYEIKKIQEPTKHISVVVLDLTGLRYSIMLEFLVFDDALNFFRMSGNVS